MVTPTCSAGTMGALGDTYSRRNGKGAPYAGPVRSRDTSSEARMVQLAVYRRMTGEQRLALAIEMSEAARTVSQDGAAARAEQAPHPRR